MIIALAWIGLITVCAAALIAGTWAGYLLASAICRRKR